MIRVVLDERMAAEIARVARRLAGMARRRRAVMMEKALRGAYLRGFEAGRAARKEEQDGQA